MTVLEQVEGLLARISPNALCDDCIADKLAIRPRQHANHKTRELEKLLGYDRRVAECSLCKRTDKKVTRRA
jgi:hypothetical protein